MVYLSAINKPNVMLTIGFTEKYYTLWNVVRFQAWTKGYDPQPYWATSFQYMRNLSMDFTKAKEKLQAFVGPEGEYAVDLTIRGHESYTIEERFTEQEKKEVKDYTFTFGRFKGIDIRDIARSEQLRLSFKNQPADLTVNDICDKNYIKDVIWQLERAMKLESTMRRRVYARRRLIELGALVRRTWYDKKPIADPFDGEAIAHKEIRYNWMPKRLAEWYEAIGDKKGTWFENGSRIKMYVREVKRKFIDTQYGTMWTINYETDIKGKLVIVTYKGSSPMVVKEEWIGITATVKHDRNETFIQRLKLIK